MELVVESFELLFLVFSLGSEFLVLLLGISEFLFEDSDLLLIVGD
jgi:hypothetical protein